MDHLRTKFLAHFHFIALLLILVFSVLTKSIGLANPERYIFDEVYHGYTAKLILENDPIIYDPWAKPPKGVAYEWTHPPLGKLIIAGFMAVFGADHFGLRSSSVFFGTLIVLLGYLLTYQSTRRPRAALLTAGLLTLEGLLFAQSRIAMIDVHLLAFCLWGIYLHFSAEAIPYENTKDRVRTRLWSLLALGLGLATKWSALYFIGFVGLHWLSNLARSRNIFHRTHLWEAFAYLSLIPSIYLMSYLHYFFMGYDFSQFIELQRQMAHYHTHLTAKHSYQSTPLEWIFNLRPVWYSVDYINETTFANIYNLGNSVLLWLGLGIAISETRTSIRNRGTPLTGILLLYFINWVPWIASPRIMFFYHYLPSVVFLLILTGAWMDRYWDRRSAAVSVEPTLFPYTWKHTLARLTPWAALGWFVLFYPNATLVPVSKKWASAIYFAVPSWK